jgi:hypothetical protein
MKNQIASAVGWLTLAAASLVVLSGRPAKAQAPGVGQSQDNIIIVLDASGSMRQTMRGSNQSRMEAAKLALRTVLKDVPANTNVGLLVFSGNLRNDWVYPLGPVDPQRLNQAIGRPQPAGGTPLGAYLKKGADALLKQRRQQQGFGTYRLLVVTDGEATDPELVEAYLPDVMSRGLTVDVIGVDMAQQHALATRVHSYRRADNPEQLVTAVSDVLAEVGGGDSGQASQEDFEVIAPLPDTLAAEMLAALARPAGDHPIGEAPPPEQNAAAADASETASGSGREAYDPFSPGPPPGTEPSSTFARIFFSILGTVCFLAVLFVVVLFIIVRMAARSGGRRGAR